MIATSYKVLQAAQCDSTGLLPNWVVPDPIEPASGGKISHECREKSPAPEFGVEAAKVAWRAHPNPNPDPDPDPNPNPNQVAWRVFLDYAWFTEEKAAATLKPLTLHAADKLHHVDDRCSEVSCHPEINHDLDHDPSPKPSPNPEQVSCNPEINLSP